MVLSLSLSQPAASASGGRVERVRVRDDIDWTAEEENALLTMQLQLANRVVVSTQIKSLKLEWDCFREQRVF